MVHILDTLARLENKFDNLALPGAAPTPDTSTTSVASMQYPSSATSSKGGLRSESDSQAGASTEIRRSYQHLTVPHKVLLWPSIYIHLINSGIQAASDLQFVLQEGTQWFIKREMNKHPAQLPYDAGLPCFAFNAGTSQQGYSSKVGFPTLTIQQINEYTDAYFSTFNVLFPILNREIFVNETVGSMIRDGYGDGDPQAVLALLVFALGAVAIDGVRERPINVANGVPSGFRGGDAERPPGLEIFNEARRRLGFVISLCSLENVQIMLLQASYYEASARHLDFWRLTVAASMAVQVLVKCQSSDWNSMQGDLLKRAYWTCVLSEDLYHLDLDLPQTGIAQLEDEVPLPYFHEVQHSPGSAGQTINDERSHFQYQFLAMVALRRLIARIHGVIYECKLALRCSLG